MNLLSKFMLKIFETGLIPEKIIRFWVRKICGDVIARASFGDIEARHAIFRQILKDLRLGRLPKHRNVIDEQSAEMGVDFYRLFLGEKLKHSCCYFPTGAEKLDEAEDTMLWMVADRAQIRDGMEILELDCGWGAMTFWLAEQFPEAKITAVSQSVSRRIYIQKQLHERGFKNVTVINSDYEELNFDKEFDRVICLEKFGELARLPQWDHKISKWTKPDGKLFAQFMVHNELTYYQSAVGMDAMPGSMINPVLIVPSSELLLHFQHEFASEDHWKISGLQYKMTAEAWLSKFYDNRLEILPLLEKAYGKRMAWIWFQRWKLCFIAVAEQYRYNRGQEWIISQYLFSLK